MEQIQGQIEDAVARTLTKRSALPRVNTLSKAAVKEIDAWTDGGGRDEVHQPEHAAHPRFRACARH